MESDGVLVAVFANRDRDADGGAAGGSGIEEKFSAKQFDAFAHAEQAEVSIALGLGDALGGEGAPVVADFEVHGSVALGESDPCAARAGVLFDVLQSFLREPEKVGDIAVVEEAESFRVNADLQSHAGAFTETIGVLFESGGETEVVEKRGTEVAGEGAHVGEGGLQVGTKVEEFLPQPRRHFVLTRETYAGRGGGEDLRDVVVQLAADVLVFLLAQFEEPLGQSLEFTDLVIGPGGQVPVFATLQNDGSRRVRGSLLLFPVAIVPVTGPLFGSVS
jgi:hypothetical protein